MRKFKKLLMKKRVKGMTLIECIIALLILSVMAAIMVRIGVTVNKVMINTNHVNNKVSAEAPYGAVQDAGGIAQIAESYTDPTDVVSDGATPVTITVGGYGSANGTRFSTAAAARQAADNGINCDTNMNADLQFYVIPEPTT